MIESFKQYLVEKGYSEETPSGHPSTVYDYSRRVQAICKRERITINQLAENINHYVQRYDTLGPEAEFGKGSNSSFINALKQFEQFKQS
jgi:hypothetical protein